MGKKRIAVLDDSSESLDKKTKKEKIVKKKKSQDGIIDMAQESLQAAEVIEEKIETGNETVEAKKPKIKKPAKKRSKSYLEAKKKIKNDKPYSISEAIKLLSNISISKFKGSIDAHINVKETGLKGEIQFQHPTGKKQNIRIADENLLKDLEKGKIDFTLLIAEPKMMPSLVKFAKLLGPRGLMPNPKNGTVTEKPEEAVKNMAGKSQFKTEAKFPLIHISIGKINMAAKELEENFKTLIKAVGRRNIKKVFLSPTMGPSIKIDLDSINN